jgi:hypothetical protein
LNRLFASALADVTAARAYSTHTFAGGQTVLHAGTNPAALP